MVNFWIYYQIGIKGIALLLMVKLRSLFVDCKRPISGGKLLIKTWLNILNFVGIIGCFASNRGGSWIIVQSTLYRLNGNNPVLYYTDSICWILNISNWAWIYTSIHLYFCICTSCALFK